MYKLAVDIGDAYGSRWGTAPGATIGTLVGMVINIIFTVAGLIVFFYFILGGYQIIAGAGNDNPQSVAKGKETISSAIIGFVVIFVAYWIIRIIEIITGTNFITAPGI